MDNSSRVAELESRIASAVGASCCVVTSSKVGRRELLIAHISTPPNKPVPVLQTMLNSPPDHVACWDALPATARESARSALEGKTIDGSCIGYGMDTADKEAIAKIWVSILHPEAIGSGDSFLELGGHSMLMIRMLNQVAETFGVRIPIYEFLDDPTITGLARQILGAGIGHG